MLRKPFTMRRKTKLYASGFLVVCIVLVVGYLALWRDTSVTVYDDNFKIVHYRMSIGRNHTFYHGNQTLGRMKSTLRSLFGLKFINPPRTTLRTGPGSLVLFVCYRGDLPFEELGGLVAVVRNDEDFFEQMWGKNRYDRDGQIFTGSFVLPNVPEGDDLLRVDFYLSSEYDEPIATLKEHDELIATLKVGELKKHKSN